MIQSRPTWLQALGFDTNGVNVNSGGTKPAELYRELAQKLLCEHANGRWAHADIKKLSIAVRNRVNV